MFLNSFNYFRALSIIIIVAGHSYGIVGMKSQNFIEKIFVNLIDGGTILFVFISGFMFHHVFCKRFNYTSFLRKKSNNILLPYLFLGFVPILFRIYSGEGEYDGYYLPQGEGFLQEYVIPYLKYLVTGNFFFSYWYIPFIFLVFIFSPLHLRFSNLKNPIQIAIILALVIISSLIHRPPLNSSILHNLVYFTPVYLLGIFISKNKDITYKILSGKEYWLLAVVIGLAAYQVTTGQLGTNGKNMFEYEGVDLLFLQKIFMCLFLMVWLNKLEDKEIPGLNILASTSFAIYFIHTPILIVINKIDIAFVNSGSWIVYPLFVAIIIGISAISAICIKKIIPKYSRKLIGY